MPKVKILKHHLTPEEYEILEQMTLADLRQHKVDIDKRMLRQLEFLLEEQRRIRLEMQNLEGAPVEVRAAFAVKKVTEPKQSDEVVKNPQLVQEQVQDWLPLDFIGKQNEKMEQPDYLSEQIVTPSESR